jgi:hypothetical protein
MSAVVIGRVVFSFASQQLYHLGGAKHAFTYSFIIAAGKALVNAKMPARQVGFAVTIYAGKNPGALSAKVYEENFQHCLEKVIS